MTGTDPSGGDSRSKNSDDNNNGYRAPEDMTAESMYAGLVSIFVVAVILFVGISVSLAGSSKCCRKRCKCCRRGRRDDDEDAGQSNAAFTDSPPTYDEVMRRDTALASHSSIRPTDIFTITAPSVECGSRSGSSGGSTTGGRFESPSLTRQDTRRSLRAILGNPPNYFEVLRNWTSGKNFTTSGGAQSKNWKSSTPPPKYSDVEKQMEEERQRNRNSNNDSENRNSTESGDGTSNDRRDCPA